MIHSGCSRIRRCSLPRIPRAIRGNPLSSTSLALQNLPFCRPRRGRTGSTADRIAYSGSCHDINCDACKRNLAVLRGLRTSTHRTITQAIRYELCRATNLRSTTD